MGISASGCPLAGRGGLLSSPQSGQPVINADLFRTGFGAAALSAFKAPAEGSADETAPMLLGIHAAAPEPSSLAPLGTGLLFTAVVLRRRRPRPLPV